MGHGSWFSHFGGTFYENVVALMHVMGWPFNAEGQTWGVLGAPHDIAHEQGHGAQAFIHLLLVAAIIAGLAAFAYRDIKDAKSALVPEDRLTVRTFMELFVGAIYGLMKDIMGDKAAKYFLPLIGTCAFVILFSNAMGLVPGFLPPTSSLSVTASMAVVIFVSTHIYGLKENGLNHVKHLFGPIIAWYALPLMLLMFVVETISHLVRPVSLSLRLMANMFADHMVVGVFVGLVPWLVPVPVLLLGSLVVVVQTLVFCLLSTIYIGLAIEHAEDHH